MADLDDHAFIDADAGATKFAELLEQLREVHDYQIQKLHTQISDMRARFQDDDERNVLYQSDCASPRSETITRSDLITRCSIDMEAPKVSTLHDLQDFPYSPSKLSAGTSNNGSQRQVTSSVSSRSGNKKSPSHLQIYKEEIPTMVSFTGPKVCLFCERIARGHWFEVMFGIIILSHAVVMACEVQYNGLQIAYELGYRGYDSPKEKQWAGAETVFDVINWVFGILYLVEIIIKVAGMRRDFFLDAWNLFDMVIVVVWVAGKVLGKIPMNANLLRLVRLVKLLRIMRLVRMIESFDSLFILTTAIKGSFKILAWSCALLVVIQMMLALILSQLLDEYYLRDAKVSAKDRLEIYLYFGSFTRAIFSMFELTLANYPVIARKLSENVDESFMIFSMFYKLTMGFAIVGVINGVFIQETMKVAATDDRVNMMQKERAKRLHAAKMRLFFMEADESGDELVSLEEFQNVLTRDEVKTWLSSLDIEVRDANLMFGLIDLDGDGEITVDELIDGIAKLKGTARTVDLHILQLELRNLSSMVTTAIGPRRSGVEVFDTVMFSSSGEIAQGPSIYSADITTRGSFQAAI